MKRTRFGVGTEAGAVLLALLGVGGLGCGQGGGGDSAHTVNTGGGGQGGGNDAGGDGSATEGGAGGSASAIPSPWKELTQAGLVVQGGSANVPGGTGTDGGKFHILAKGTATLDPSIAPTAAPAIPAAPGDATKLAAGDLDSDVTAPGSVVIDGSVVAGGSDNIRTITASAGDIFITGKLRGADLGGTRQGIHLVANGNVFITGTLDTSGGGTSSQGGGEIQVTAQQVVVTGTVTSGGGAGRATGGGGGAITMTSTGVIYLGGALDSLGGDARGPGVTTGGDAGAITLKAGGDVVLAGTVRLRGGAGSSTGLDAHGGAGAVLTIDADSTVQMGGTVDGRGGLATALVSGGVVAAGAAGSIKVGETASPQSIQILVPVVATGGDGDASGGVGGAVNLESGDSDLTIAGVPAVDVTGGGSMTKAGTGGTIDATPHHWATGNLHITGLIVANGGSIEDGGDGTGGDAGVVTLEVNPTDGKLMLDQSGKVTADGGQSRGATVAGGGGHVFIWTKDGDLTVAGSVSARGGTAVDDGGHGGLGGMVYCFSDANHNAKFNDKGHLLIAPTGVIDTSGGEGTVGGDARSNGRQWSVPVFPDHQEEIAIFLNCDGVHGTTFNWLDNQGQLIARGGAHNGNGGDIVYHGIAPDRNASPPSGNIDNAGDGTGKKGDFLGE